MFDPRKDEPNSDPDIPKRRALNGFWKRNRGNF
jgi:hypothetical protein